MGVVTMRWELSNPKATEIAIWKGQRIRVEVVRPKTRTRGTASGNVIADSGNITLKTRYMRPWGINDEILFRGKRFVITDISQSSYNVNTQSMSYIRPDMFLETTFTLFEVGQMTRNLRVPTPVITSDGTNITISVDLLDTNIYYTIDGTYPSSLSAKYVEPFAVGSIDTVYAIATRKGYQKSDVGVWKIT